MMVPWIARLLPLLALLLMGQDFGSGAPHVGGIWDEPPTFVTGEIFTEDCTTALGGGWTNHSDDLGSGQGSTEVSAGTCTQTYPDANVGVVYSGTDTDTLSNFCKMIVLDTHNTTGIEHGCAFRVQGTPGNWIEAIMDNGANAYRIRMMSGFTVTSSTDGDVTCGCSTYTDINDADWIGFKVSGTDAGADFTVDFYDFGASEPNDDPSHADWDTPRCACSYAEIDAIPLSGYVDTVGGCGWSMTRNGSGSGQLAEWDRLRCGDQ